MQGAYLIVVRDSFDRIADGTERVLQRHSGGPSRTFAQREVGSVCRPSHYPPMHTASMSRVLKCREADSDSLESGESDARFCEFVERRVDGRLGSRELNSPWVRFSPRKITGDAGKSSRAAINAEQDAVDADSTFALTVADFDCRVEFCSWRMRNGASC
jgi:hypothetical protein